MHKVDLSTFANHEEMYKAADELIKENRDTPENWDEILAEFPDKIIPGYKMLDQFYYLKNGGCGDPPANS